MSLFVHPENQKILWNIINGNPFIIRYFEAKPSQAKESWFRQSIENFYTKIQGKEINPDELNYLNKEVLTSMIQSVHIQSPTYTAHDSNQSTSQSGTPSHPQYTPQNGNPSYSQQSPSEPMNMMTHNNTINTPSIVKDSKEEIFNKQFQMRQQEYDTMLHHKTPQEIDFRETSNDENKDINELLERERREREELMKPIQQSNKLNIDSSNNDNMNIKLEAVELQGTTEKKSVSWNEDVKPDKITEILEVQKSETYSMRLHIVDLTKQLERANERLTTLETILNKMNTNNTNNTNEKPQHHVSKYANLEETPTYPPVKETEVETVLVEDVNTDSDT